MSTGIANPGYINIEFEQIVYNDITRRIESGNSNIGDLWNTSAGKDSYQAWINSLTTNGASYPDLTNISTFNSDFSTHLNSFKIHGKNYNSPIINLSPNALHQLFDGTVIKQSQY